jgi:glycosyltransferase involved in cell wall biosynthesis
MPNKKNLMLTYCFPPFPGPESFLAAKLFSNMPNSDFNVLTIRPLKAWMSDEDEFFCHLVNKISKVIQIDPPNWIRFVPLAKRDLPKSNSRVGFRLFTKIIWKISSFGAILLRLPDPFRIFNPFVYKSALSHSQNYETIFTWAQYNSMSLVGLKIKKKLGKRIIWVSYFGDPWHQNPYVPLTGLTKKLNYRMQTNVFLNADLLLFPTEEMADYMTQNYGSAVKAKCKILPHSFDASLYPVETSSKSGPYITFKYIGQFYGPRKSELIIAGISVLLDRRPNLRAILRVEFIGGVAQNRLFENKFKDVLIQSPQVKYLQSLIEMKEADCLISLDAPTERNIFMSGKISDYIGARKPIIAITNIGATSKLISEYGGWIADPKKPEEIADAFENAISWIEVNKGIQFGNNEIYDSLQAKNIASKLLDIIEEIK